MSGHSHWATIKHKKAAVDAKRGKLFSKLARAIAVAARGGPDPAFNAKLRTAIEQAKAAGLAKENIERAVKKGSGTVEGEALTEITYEAFGPGGAAMLIECITDNASRTLPEIRKTVEQYNGKMGSAGTVAWMFQRKSLIAVAKTDVDEETLMGLVIDAGAEDVAAEADVYEIISPAEAHSKVMKALAGANITPKVSQLMLMATNEISPDKSTQEKVLRLMAALEDHDDVQNVYVNFKPTAEAVAGVE